MSNNNGGGLSETLDLENDDNSSNESKIQPWHYGLGAGLAVGAGVTAAVVIGVVTKKKEKLSTKAMAEELKKENIV